MRCGLCKYLNIKSNGTFFTPLCAGSLSHAQLLHPSKLLSLPADNTHTLLSITHAAANQRKIDNCNSAGFLFYGAGLIVQKNPFKIVLLFLVAFFSGRDNEQSSNYSQFIASFDSNRIWGEAGRKRLLKGVNIPESIKTTVHFAKLLTLRQTAN